MSKHESKTQILTLGELIGRIGQHTDGSWTDVMCIDVPGLAEAESRGGDDDYAEASRIESEYIKAHENDHYEVSWPDHVTYPRFNGDANYSRV